MSIGTSGRIAATSVMAAEAATLGGATTRRRIRPGSGSTIR